MAKTKEFILQDLFQKEFIILDGATGTMLQKNGLKLGEHPEVLNFTNSELIKQIHRQYLNAGSDIVYTNTFGANRQKVVGTGYEVKELVQKAVELAKEVTAELGGYVALDIGPIGELLEPSGILKFEEAYDIFKEMIIVGRDAGADLILFETMTDLYEVKAGVLAAKENCDLPIFVTMTFEQNARTFTGCGIENMALTLEGLGVDAMGMNCSLGPIEILPLMQELAKHTSLPLIAKPNAGLPDPETSEYNISAEEFGEIMRGYADAGVQIMGGCCGSDDTFIKSLCDNLKDKKRGERNFVRKTKFCTATDVVTVDTVRVIGERINPTGKKRFAQALVNYEMDYILSQAIEQVEAGADILDVNVGVPQTDEMQMMTHIIKAIQAVVSVPLQIDSSKYEALEAGLRVYNGKPILNSVSGETEVLEKILPLAKKYGSAVVALTIDEEGIPKTAEKRFEVAQKILKYAEKYGVPKEDILVDCLTLTVSAQQKDCFETLNAMARIKKELGVELVLGVSNISFGLPNRNLINHSFLTVAMSHGLTLPIINPNTESMMDAVLAYRVLSGYDVDSEKFIEKYANYIPPTHTSSSAPTNTNTTNQTSTITSTSENNTPEQQLENAILKGLSDQVTILTKELLQEHDALHIINQMLIPTLDIVGQKYESGEFFLPQLIRSANASCNAFNVIKEVIASSDGESVSKGKIILATVKGDIHDIGKNIVKVVLENYGYEILDLGKDVPPELVVETAVKHDVKLVGLSALMTTTVESMKNTIEQLREANHDCKVMVGGAVLTEEYAKKIGADFYAKDAKQSADIAKELLS